jgi:hypothetical protein
VTKEDVDVKKIPKVGMSMVVREYVIDWIGWQLGTAIIGLP